MDQLGTIDEILGVGELVVPEGTFQSTRVSKGRKGDDSRIRPDVLRSANARTYAAFPPAYTVGSASFPSPPSTTFTQEPVISSLPTLSSPYRQPPETQQFAVPLTMPQMAVPSSTLAPIRSGDTDMDYKFRRLSLPALVSHPLALRDRGASLGASSTVDYSSSTERGMAMRSHDREVSPLAHQGMESAAWYERSEVAWNGVGYANGGRSSRSPLASPSPHHQTNTRTPDSSGGSTPNMSSPPMYLSQATNVISLPPPGQLLRAEATSQLYEVTSPGSGESAGVGPCRVELAPLHSLQRSHPYRRDPVDDKTLRLLGPRAG